MYHVHLVRPEPRRQLFYPMPVDPMDPSIIGQPLVDDMGSFRPNGGNGHGAADLSGAKGAPKIGRNDPCPCGSGKKYKKCHLGREDYA
jgi:preprotein translocase subunit SecA